ncbi:delta tubulin, putative [Bodo saltans]|uniref:Delta tubulin, putative n=1 Tax=Bodo saltans TaxID=75058 RepID=A0A0S4JK93_BODSA|nr:delta tubulin, putative [Bodo saltans]|eukprot:CUG89389.1 delta tubulin, putative [Bodo saltans]
MSFTPTITVLVGQCGNQLGVSFLNAVASAAAATAQPHHRDADDDRSTRGAAAATDSIFRERVANEFFRQPTKSEEKSHTQELFENDDNGIISSSSSSLVARAVLVDMEPKVMEQTRLSMKRDRRQLFTIHASQCVSREEGSANNWAFGYFTQGVSKLDDLEQRLRHEVRLASDNWYGGGTAGGVGVKFHVVHSIAGGTGSGVGCLVSELIADLFPKSEIHHTVVWPFQHGEVVTQNYNAILAVSALRDTADSVLVLSNDEIAEEMRSRHQGGGHALAQGLSAASSFREINHSMAKLMSSLHLPLEVLPLAKRAALEKRSRAVVVATAHHQSPSSSASADDAWRTSMLRCAPRAALMCDVRELLDLDPVKKFFTGSTFPRNIQSLASTLQQVSWQSVVQEATRYVCTVRAAQPLFVLRGRGSRDEGSRELMHALAMHHGAAARPSQGGGSRSGLPYSVFGDGAYGLLASETPRIDDVHADSDASGGVGYRRGDGRDTSSAVFHTSPSIFRSSTLSSPSANGGGLEHSLGRVQGMLQEKAFVHHYSRYGVSDDDIQNACIRCWELLEAYRDEELDDGDEVF